MSTQKGTGSLYYVSDKNILDALNQAKVDNETVRGMFERRNIICSKKTSREDLAKYFSTLTHDFLDHQDIAGRLGAISRRNRTTTVDIEDSFSSDQIDKATQKLSEHFRTEGDVIHITKNSTSTLINIKYTEVDYKQSEFRQLQHKDGEIELIKQGNGYVLRSTQSDHVNVVRDEFIRKLGLEASITPSTFRISLYEFPSPKIRSKFFHDLMTNLPGYVRRDVTDVYVHKAGSNKIAEDSKDLDDPDDGDVQRVFLRGSAITRSKLLDDLLKDEKYYIFRVVWLAVETMGKGYGFAIEVLFHNPIDCDGFTYHLRGVHVLDENGKLTKHRRIPTKDESDAIAKVVETGARQNIAKIRTELSIQPTKGG